MNTTIGFDDSRLAPAALPMRHEATSTLPMGRPLEIRFTGSGSEYFRIWIVNLLLTILTLSLYRPWAKVRRLRYFYGNTFIDGHTLDFHGNPRRMLRGQLLVGLMLLAYSVGTRTSPLAAAVAVTAFAVLWPALWRASMQFRLANTSWRGLRFRFGGGLAGAYATLLPLFVPALAFVALGLFIRPGQQPPRAVGFGLAWVMLATLLMLPLLTWRLKRYQHGHFELGDWRTRLDLGVGRFYLLYLKLAGLGLLMLMLAAVIVVSLMATLGLMHTLAVAPRLPTAFIFPAVLLLAWFAMAAVLYPWAVSALQNLVWGRTHGDEVAFESRLRFGAMCGLTLRNFALTLCTLGLYWPFAAVAIWRLRVQAVTPVVHGDLDALRGSRRGTMSDASGDAAGDFFGIDIGL